MSDDRTGVYFTTENVSNSTKIRHERASSKSNPSVDAEKDSMVIMR